MALKALLCDAAKTAAGRIHVLGGWGSHRLQGPRKGVSGAIAGVVLDVPADRVGKQLRIGARLGTIHGVDSRSWRAVKAGGRPVQAQRSVTVPPGGGGGPANVPFVLELPLVDLARERYAWKLSSAGGGALLPFYDNFGQGDVDPLPDGNLFLCDAATVADEQLFMIGARAEPVLAPEDTARWGLAGRMSKPTDNGSGFERVEVKAELRGPGGTSVTSVKQEVEVRRPEGPRSDWAPVEVPIAIELPQAKLEPGDYAWSVDAGDLFEYVEFTVGGSA
jgi:hypothetical protein